MTTTTTTAPAPDFAHLLSLTDARGTFEHARFSTPRSEHGYCTDDAARVLVVAAREPEASPEVQRLAATALQFVAEGQAPNGRVRNRVDEHGRWKDAPGVDDCWGRSIWGFATAAVHGDADRCDRAVERFARAARWRSPWPRAMAYAAIGAAELLTVRPGQRAARALLEDAARVHAAPAGDDAWPWPEARLTYANAVLPEAMLAIGVGLERPELVDRGLHLLAWLVDHETRDGHLSVVPAGGAGPDELGPAFDQQPIEVAAIAEACARAATVDADPRWAAGVAAAVAWFAGDNDAGTVMWDPSTGGGFDGLEEGGRNENQGAESTIAVVATHQLARRFAGNPL